MVTGDFIRFCFRPVNILFYFMSETIDIKGFSQMVLGTVILVWSWCKLGLIVTPVRILLLLFFLFGAVLICMALMIFASTFGFMGGETNAAVFMASDLKGYGEYPLTIFNKFLRFIFTFCIPIGFIAYYPSCFFMFGRDQVSVLTYLSPLFGIVFFVLASKFWIYYANRYAGTGS